MRHKWRHISKFNFPNSFLWTSYELKKFPDCDVISNAQEFFIFEGTILFLSPMGTPHVMTCHRKCQYCRKCLLSILVEIILKFQKLANHKMYYFVKKNFKLLLTGLILLWLIFQISLNFKCLQKLFGWLID
jgi:hypothetical protein